MTYKGIVKINKEDFEYAKECYEDINKGCKDDFLTLGSCVFDNGITLYIDLCSGEYNYYLQYDMTDTHSNCVDADTLDISDLNIGFEIDDTNDKYIVRVIVE